ncbi:MAG TPA: phosphoenolpyruvate mutase [Verrucomicrobiota bacterium]|nr:phosphoenolpyruvate mutase [Verrucomicrobiota bacterium]
MAAPGPVKWRGVKKTLQFRRLLESSHLEFLMEAHNGLSARIVEEAGFKGIWASGLAISAALGVRDNNEASWTQVLEVIEFMADATRVPILLDGDTGFGNFNNVRRLVKKLEQRGIAAVCIEDKLFPKTNSFIHGERQPLADVEEFCGKVKAVKDAQSDPDFCLVARLEAFIAGWGLDEALRRADAYHRAGADALLVHSRKPTPDEILKFTRAWGNRCPLLIVPTTYYSTPVEVFEQAGIRVVIWANHTVRASIMAMQTFSRRVFQERSVRNVEDQIAPLREVFRLQNADELLEAEARYLPKNGHAPRAIILAASQGSELGELTRARPKAMLQVNGRPLLHKLVAQFQSERIKDIVVVRGFGREEVNVPGAQFVDNEEFEGTAELLSLSKAVSALEGPVVISFGDILFRRYILQSLLADPGDITIVVDAAWQQRRREQNYVDYIKATHPYSARYHEEEPALVDIGSHLRHEEVNGEWIGLLKATPRGAEQIRSALDVLRAKPGFARMRFNELFLELLARGETIRVLYITGHWLDVDNLEDLTAANAFVGYTAS